MTCSTKPFRVDSPIISLQRTVLSPTIQVSLSGSDFGQTYVLVVGRFWSRAERINGKGSKMPVDFVRLFEKARSGDREALASLQNECRDGLLGCIEDAFHLDGVEGEALADRMLERSDCYLIAESKGGYGQYFPVSPEQFVLNAFLVNLVALARADLEQVLRNTDRERAVVLSSCRDIREFWAVVMPPLRTLLLQLVPFLHRKLRESDPSVEWYVDLLPEGKDPSLVDITIDGIFNEDGSSILRSPEEGGFCYHMKVIFSTWILYHAPWTRNYRRGNDDINRPKGVVGLPKGDGGNIPAPPPPLPIHSEVNPDDLATAGFGRFPALFLLLSLHPRTGSPHQQLAFLYAKWILATTGEGGVRASTRALDEGYGREPFTVLSRGLADKLEFMDSAASLARRVLKRFHGRLLALVGESLKGDINTRTHLTWRASDSMGAVWFRQIYGFDGYLVARSEQKMPEVIGSDTEGTVLFQRLQRELSVQILNSKKSIVYAGSLQRWITGQTRLMKALRRDLRKYEGYQVLLVGCLGEWEKDYSDTVLLGELDGKIRIQVYGGEKRLRQNLMEASLVGRPYELNRLKKLLEKLSRKLGPDAGLDDSQRRKVLGQVAELIDWGKCCQTRLGEFQDRLVNLERVEATVAGQAASHPLTEESKRMVWQFMCRHVLIHQDDFCQAFGEDNNDWKHFSFLDYGFDFPDSPRPRSWIVCEDLGEDELLMGIDATQTIRFAGLRSELTGNSLGLRRFFENEVDTLVRGSAVGLSQAAADVLADGLWVFGEQPFYQALVSDWSFKVRKKVCRELGVDPSMSNFEILRHLAAQDFESLWNEFYNSPEWNQGEDEDEGEENDGNGGPKTDEPDDIDEGDSENDPQGS